MVEALQNGVQKSRALWFAERIFRALFAGLLLVLVILVLGALPVPANGLAAQGPKVEIFVLSNGFHSDIALPVDDAETLSVLGVSTTDYPVDMSQARYIAFGWGSQVAYTSLREVSDLSVGIIARALVFDRTVVHAQPVGELQEGKGIYRLELPEPDYRHLVRSIARSFSRESNGKPIVLDGITQGFGDVFYRGAGFFSPLTTCNSWTGQELRKAGIGVGLWTPSAMGLEYGLDRAAARSRN